MASFLGLPGVGIMGGEDDVLALDGHLLGLDASFSTLELLVQDGAQGLHFPQMLGHLRGGSVNAIQEPVAILTCPPQCLPDFVFGQFPITLAFVIGNGANGPTTNGLVQGKVLEREEVACFLTYETIRIIRLEKNVAQRRCVGRYLVVPAFLY